MVPPRQRAFESASTSASSGSVLIKLECACLHEGQGKAGDLEGIVRGEREENKGVTSVTVS
jgi:hypothetical protein